MAGSDSPPLTRPDASTRNRRSSVTTATLSNIFRSNSVSSPSGTPAVPGPITTAALNDRTRRRLSISTATALGLSGTSPVSAGAGAGPGSAGGIPAAAFALRRASQSTASSVSDAIADESAIDDDDMGPVPPRAAPNSNTATQARRTSFGAQGIRSGGVGTAIGNGRQNRPRQPPPAAFLAASRSPSLSSSSVFASSASGGGRPSAPNPSVRHASPRPVPSSPVSPPAPRALPSDGPRAAAVVQSPRSPRIPSDNIFFPAAHADQGYNWSEQLRSRAESVASGGRASFSFGSVAGSSPPRAGGGFGVGGGVGYHHGRAKSVSDGSASVPAPVPPPAKQQQQQQQQQPPAPQPKPAARPKPDAFQERILKGDFYMD